MKKLLVLVLILSFSITGCNFTQDLSVDDVVNYATNIDLGTIKSTLYSELAKLNIDAEKLEELGLDNIESLKTLSEEDIKSVLNKLQDSESMSNLVNEITNITSGVSEEDAEKYLESFKSLADYSDSVDLSSEDVNKAIELLEQLNVLDTAGVLDKEYDYLNLTNKDILDLIVKLSQNKELLSGDVSAIVKETEKYLDNSNSGLGHIINTLKSYMEVPDEG